MNILLVKLSNLLITCVSVMVSGDLCRFGVALPSLQNGRDHQKPRRTHNE